jgi:hypothetical protein
MIDSIIARAKTLDRQSPDVKVTANTAAARAAVDQFIRSQSMRTISLAVVRRNTGPAGGDVPGSANGGTVGGRRRPYGDKVLTYLAPGEEVISNRYGQADRNRALLKRINANRYANGGTVPEHFRSHRPGHASALGGAGGRMALTITNWDEGTGYVEAIADERYYGNQALG